MCEQNALEERRQASRIAEEKRIAAMRRKKRRARIIGIAAVAMAIGIALFTSKILLPFIASHGHYREAEQLWAEKRYAEASAEFAAAGDYADAAERTLEANYEAAAALLAEGEYGKAYAILARMREYGDVETLLRSNPDLVSAARVAEARMEPFRTVGGEVTFGHYEQDNDASNGQEEIEWIVLAYDEQAGSSLLLSKYCLDARAFQSHGYIDTIWERSEMRDWLNNAFLQAAFAPSERDCILRTRVATPDDINGRAKTQDTADQVFLLSRGEAAEYFEGDYARQAIPTEYAAARGAVQNAAPAADGKSCCWWWLRSPGVNGRGALAVNGYGILCTTQPNDNIAVRPAIWVDLWSL